MKHFSLQWTTYKDLPVSSRLTAVLDRPARWGTQWTALIRHNFPYTFESGYYIRNTDIESARILRSIFPQNV
jgi:hypothetical protein